MRKLGLVILLLLAACTPAANQNNNPTLPPVTPPPTTIPATIEIDALTDIAVTLEVTPEATAEAAVTRPAWHNIALTNARTGETFTFADFEGRVVSVEPMATWCTNCRLQQGTVRQIAPQFSDDVVFVSLSVGENIDDQTLAAYAEREGFDWVFAAAPPELLNALVEQFGRGVTSPPSTPHFYIDRDGTTTTLSTGAKSADELTQTLTWLIEA